MANILNTLEKRKADGVVSLIAKATISSNYTRLASRISRLRQASRTGANPVTRLIEESSWEAYKLSVRSYERSLVPDAALFMCGGEVYNFVKDAYNLYTKVDEHGFTTQLAGITCSFILDRSGSFIKEFLVIRDVGKMVSLARWKRSHASERFERSYWSRG